MGVTVAIEIKSLHLSACFELVDGKLITHDQFLVSLTNPRLPQNTELVDMLEYKYSMKSMTNDTKIITKYD